MVNLHMLKYLLPGKKVAFLVPFEVGVVGPTLLLPLLAGQQGLPVLDGKVHNGPPLRPKNRRVVVQVAQGRQRILVPHEAHKAKLLGGTHPVLQARHVAHHFGLTHARLLGHVLRHKFPQTAVVQ